MALTIELTERGPAAVVSAVDWQTLNLELPLRALEAQGVIRIAHSTAAVVVTPSYYVGEMRAPGVILRIAPKNHELLKAMEKFALRARTRSARHFDVEQVRTEAEGTDVASAFVRSLLRTVQEGIPWSYAASQIETLFPCGRLNCAATMRRLASRGIQHRVIVRVPIRTHDRDFVRVVRTAHRCLPSATGAAAPVLANAEALMAALDWHDTFSDLNEAIAVAEDLASRMTPRETARELVLWSLALLLREYRAGGAVQTVPGGIASFRNLEDLWERTVQRFVECAPVVLGNGSAQFHGLSGRGTRLFADGGPVIDPDVVVITNSVVTAIVDAKYKRLDAGALAGDVYQITCYLRSTQARLGVLIYFSEETPHVGVLGTTHDGALVVAASLSPEIIISEGECALAGLIGANRPLKQRVEDCLGHSASQQGADGISDLSGHILFGA